jgi:CHAT domain-containing protein
MGIDGVQREVNVAAPRFASPRASRWFLFAGMILAIVPLPACQRAMSVEEAKKVTTSFSGSSLMAPPRESADILGILDERKTEKAPGLAAAEAKVSQPVPESRDPAALATFFYERGVAARRVGRPQQAVGDLRQALAYARQARVREYRILAHLAWAEEAGGSEDRAIEYLREAIAAVPANDRGWLFGLTHGLVWMLGRRGDLQGAEAALKNLSAVLVESNGWKDTLPRTRQLWNAFLSNGQAFLAEVRGDFAKAEVLYRESAAELAKDPLNAGSYEYDLRLARLGRVLAAQGRLLEGETEARRAVLGAVRRSGRYSLETAIVVNYLTNVMLSQRRYADAERLARAGVEIWEKIGTPADSILMAFTRGNLGNALQAQGRSRDALAQFEIIRVGLSGDSEAFQKHFSSHMNWGFARLDTGDPRGALGIFEAGLSRSQRLRGENDRSTANWRGAVAIARRATGDRERALAEFKAAVPRLLDPSAVNSAEDQEAIQVSGRGLRDVVLSNYLGMLVDVRGTDLETKTGLDATAEAFRVAEVLRSQAVQRAVGAAAARTAAKDPALADLIRQEQDAARREAALRATLANALSLPAGQQDAQSIGSLRQEVDILRRARLALADQITKGFPEYAKLVNPAPTTIEQARAVLRPGEALITTYVAANRTFVWAVPQSGPIAFSVVALGSSGLGRKIAEIRMALDPGTVQTLGDIPPFDVARAYDLYRQLLEPVRAGWERSTSLLVVPHGPLGQLPFAVLPTDATAVGPDERPLFSSYRRVRWLVRTHAVTVLPSVGSLVTLRALPPGDPTRRPVVGFGDPWFSEEQARRAAVETGSPASGVTVSTRGVSIALRASPRREAVSASQLAQLPRLPETGEEIRSIALAMNADLTKDVFLGAQANEKTVRTMKLSGYRVVVFATHGLIPGDLEGLTQPALALSAPSVSGAEGDGLLTMEKILGLRLNADWVVLSACNTAAGNGAGSEAVSGLGRAFFYAGARALLVSNWPVETTSAKALTTELFRRQAADPRQTRAQALQQTVNVVMDGLGYTDPATKQVVFSYAHPIFWAPFTLVGDGGASAPAKP